MGRYITPAPSVTQSGPVKKQQVFKTSGTFLPSQKLLDTGGVVTVRCVGGGGSSGGGGGSGGSGGSSGMDVTRMCTVTGPVEVMIGAGGGKGYDGGDTLFGVVLKANGGKRGTTNTPGTSVGEGSMPGHPSNALSLPGRGGGIGGGAGVSQLTPATAPFTCAVPNTGGGGGGVQYGYTTLPHCTGGSGICIVEWEE